MSKIIANAENKENVEIICQSCVGTFQQCEIKPARLFGLQKFVKWIYRCNACLYQSKVYCTRIQQPTEK